MSTWNEGIEQTVKSIGENAKGYKIMHINTAISDAKWHNGLMHTNITMSLLGSLLSGIGAAVSDTINPLIFPIIVMIIVFIASLVAAIIKYSKFEQKSAAHKQAAAKYTSIESNIRRQLQLYRVDRVDASEYLEWLSKSYDDLFMASPLISTSIYHKYVLYAHKHKITIPDNYDITINLDNMYIDQKTEEIINETQIEVNQGSKEESEEEEVIVEISEKSSETKRTEVYTPFPDFERYSDGQMRYEMKRLMGFK